MTSTAATSVAAPPAAVLWDMDGTLVDTEPYWIECEFNLVRSHGGTWTEEDARSIIGADLLDAAAVIRLRGGVDLPEREIVERLLDGVTARVRERIPWRPGARRLLAELNAQGVPCALVTMSWRRFVEAVVEALPPGSFQTAVSGDLVAHGKPHPEPYLTAARRLGVDPALCVAIEDSPRGVTSAESAGCTVVAVPHLVAIEPGERRVLVPSLRDVRADDLASMLLAPPAAAADRSPPRRTERRLVPIVAAVSVLAAGAVAVGIARDGDDAIDERAAAPPTGLAVDAWAPYWALDDSLDELADRASTFRELSPFWYVATGAVEIGTDPNATDEDIDRFLDIAREADAPLVPSIVDATAAGEMAAILADADQRERHVDAVADFAADGDFAGIDLDYEQFAFADGRDTWGTTRPNWVAFVTALAGRLHDDGRTLTVSVPPVYDGDRDDGSGFWVYDHAAMAEVVDRIRIMAYDYSTSEPGPVAPLDYVRRAIDGALDATGGDPTKLVLGVPLYGYNWPVDVDGDCPDAAQPERTTVTNRTVDDLIARRGATAEYDPDLGEWSFTYEMVVEDGSTSCTVTREAHYVDADGAQARMQLAVDAGFAGVSLWALGYDDSGVWGAITTVAASMEPSSTTMP